MDADKKKIFILQIKPRSLLYSIKLSAFIRVYLRFYSSLCIYETKFVLISHPFIFCFLV
jgi:hypothetical protein